MGFSVTKDGMVDYDAHGVSIKAAFVISYSIFMGNEIIYWSSMRFAQGACVMDRVFYGLRDVKILPHVSHSFAALFFVKLTCHF